MRDDLTANAAAISSEAEARAAARPIGLATDLATGSSRIITPPDAPDRFRLDRAGLDDDGTFITIQNPPLRMIIVGAVHIAQPLVGMARACGYAPVLIDPRGAFGSDARFPGETIIEDWPDEALDATGDKGACKKNTSVKLPVRKRIKIPSPNSWRKQSRR